MRTVLEALAYIYESLIFLSWCLSFLLVSIQVNTKISWLGVLLSPAILLIYTFGSFYLPNDLHQISPLIPALKSNWLMMHVTVMLLSYAALLSGSLLAIAFVILSIFKKSQKIGQLLFLLNHKNNFSENPTLELTILENLDNLSYRIIGLGFPFLTVGILSGAVWANEAWGSYWSWDPKETWALITWLIFAIYLHMRFVRQWVGLKASLLASLGFFLIWICYLGVNLLGKGLHSYGWFV